MPAQPRYLFLQESCTLFNTRALASIWKGRVRMKMFRSVLGAAFVVLALAIMGLAQTGSIQGTVSDKSGAIIPNADVNIVNLDTGIVHASKTNSTGAFNV